MLEILLTTWTLLNCRNWILTILNEFQSSGKVYLGNNFWLQNEAQRPHMCSAVKIPIDLYVSLLAVFPWHLLLTLSSAIGVSATASTPCKHYVSSSRSAWVEYICSTFTFFLLIIVYNLFCWHMHWSFIQENIHWVWNKQIKYIYLGFSNKIARNFQLHINYLNWR